MTEPQTSKGQNLALRLASSAVLLPLIIWLIVLGGRAFAGLAAAAAAICTQELYAMTLGGPGVPRPAKLPYIAWLGVLLAAATPFAALVPGLLGRAAPLGLALLVMASLASGLFREGELQRLAEEAPRLVFGLLYGTLMMALLVRIRAFPNGAWWVLLACTVSWLNDTGAYFVGHALGRHKLSPRVSPGKTWEGFFGGMAASILAAFAVNRLGALGLTPVGCALLGLGAGLLGPTGDLSESLLKRGFGVKDSGFIMPGHGGLLDRIDALIFNIPLVYLCGLIAMGYPA
ncbi:MAG: phosphatidate cytidylyltransferase [Deltaproteobacteria bacterium]